MTQPRTGRLGGATAGKAICGLRVLTEDHKPCTLPKAIGRNLAYYIDALFFGLVGWTSMSKSAQSLGLRSPAIGIVVGFVAYGALQVLAVVLKAV